MYDPIGIPAIYLTKAPAQVRIDQLADLKSFQVWAAQKRPDWIVVSPVVFSQYHVTPAELDAFLARGLGYVPHSCPAKTGITIYDLRN
jgi:hypothetical protein